MKMFGGLIFVLAVAWQPAIGQSGLLTGNQLHETCNSSRDTALYAFCTGYVMGHVEGFKWGSFTTINRALEPADADEGNSLVELFSGFCIPEDANYQQIIDVTVNYLADNPATRHESARGLIWLGLIDVFPCR